MSYDDWNITNVPRSVHPHLIVKDHQHILPPKALGNHVIGGLHDSTEDDRLLRRLYEIKVKLFACVYVGVLHQIKCLCY